MKVSWYNETYIYRNDNSYSYFGMDCGQYDFNRDYIGFLLSNNNWFLYTVYGNINSSNDTGGLNGN